MASEPAKNTEVNSHEIEPQCARANRRTDQKAVSLRAQKTNHFDAKDADADKPQVLQCLPLGQAARTPIRERPEDDQSHQRPDECLGHEGPHAAAQHSHDDCGQPARNRAGQPSNRQ
jgi:hypothetical protein